MKLVTFARRNPGALRHVTVHAMGATGGHGEVWPVVFQRCNERGGRGMHELECADEGSLIERYGRCEVEDVLTFGGKASVLYVSKEES